MQSCLLSRLFQGKQRTHTSQSTSSQDPSCPHLCACPGQVLGPISFSSFPVQAGLVFHGVGAPVLLPPHEMLPFLPLLLVSSPQMLPAPQPMAVPCCAGPHCPKSHEAEPCLHIWSKESECYCESVGEMFDMLPASKVWLLNTWFFPPLNSQ